MTCTCEGGPRWAGAIPLEYDGDPDCPIHGYDDAFVFDPRELRYHAETRHGGASVAHGPTKEAENADS